jgi:hypothetical protein
MPPTSSGLKFQPSKEPARSNNQANEMNCHYCWLLALLLAHFEN